MLTGDSLPIRILSIISFTILFLPLLAQNQKTYEFYEVPKFEGKLVFDDAGLLKPETIERLEKTLRTVQDSVGYEIAVLTIYDLSGMINSYARKTMYEWKLGDRKKEQGILMLIVKQKREVRIEVGKGLVEILTPEECQKIIDHEIIPNFKEENYNEGAIAAIQGIIGGLRGTYDPPQAKTNYGIIFLVIAIVVIIVSFVGLFSKSYFMAAYAGLIPFYGVFVGPTLSWWIAGAFVAGFPLFRWLIVKSKIKLLRFGENANNGSGGSYNEDEYDRMMRRNAALDSGDSDRSSSSDSSSDSSGASGRW